MKSIKKGIYISLIGCLVSFQLLAQTPFREGVLIYKADTVRRLEFVPAGYIPSQTVVYKKGDLLRFEVWRVNQFNPTDVQKDIYIRNKKGTYLFNDSSDSSVAMDKNLAIFMSYDDEKLFRAERALLGIETYVVDKSIQKITWLGIPAEKVSLKGNQPGESLDAIITNAINIPVGVLYDPVRKLPGTPLQFIIDERGWRTRYTATSLKSQPVVDALFEIDSNRKLMNLSEMINEISNVK